MNKIVLILLTAFLTLFSDPAFAQTADQVAVVDLKKILEKSSATQSIQKEIEKKRNEIQEEISKQEEKLRKTDKDLADQRSIMDKEVFDKKVKEFKTEVVEAQRNAQNKRASLEHAYASSLKEVEKVVVSIVAELAGKKGFSVAIPRSNAIYSKSSLDISDEVLETLNKRLPKVKVKLEK